jgi:hypothetical protein
VEELWHCASLNALLKTLSASRCDTVARHRESFRPNFLHVVAVDIRGYCQTWPRRHVPALTESLSQYAQTFESS